MAEGLCERAADPRRMCQFISVIRTDKPRYLRDQLMNCFYISNCLVSESDNRNSFIKTKSANLVFVMNIMLGKTGN